MNPENKKYILENRNVKSVKDIAKYLHLKEKAVRRLLEKETVKGGGKVSENKVESQSRFGNLIPILLIIILAFVGYGNSLGNSFVWDDMDLIAKNSSIESFSNIAYMFKSDLLQHAKLQTGYYRPIQLISYMVDHFLWGLQPFGYHMTSLLLQVICAILVFYLCFFVTKKRLKSLFVAAVFCIHPAFVPIVGYIAGRADLLGFLFSIVTIYLVLVHSRRGGKAIALWVALFFYILAILSKEYYLFTPFFVILYLFIYRDEIKFSLSMKIFIASMVLAALAYIVFRGTMLNLHQKMQTLESVPFSDRAQVFPYILTGYVGTLLFPFNLVMNKKLIYDSLSEPRFLFSYIVPLLIGLSIYYFYRARQKEKCFFLSWFILGLIPVSNLFIELKFFSADHWAYMASIGFFGFISLSIDGFAKWFYSERVFRKIKLFCAIILVFVFTCLAIKENRYWKNEDTLFTKIFEKNPDSARSKFNMAVIYLRKNDREKALELLSGAIDGNPVAPAEYYDRRGSLYRELGDLKKAVADLEKAVKISPRISTYHNHLGCAYAELGMHDKAVEEWQEAVKIDPNDELARKNLNNIAVNT